MFESGARYDVAVVGAGPAGSATALWLARGGCRVALIERTRFTQCRVGESLAPAVQPLLEELGVWREFLGLRPEPSHGTRSVWGDATPRVHSHVMSPWGCGWHVDRLAFDRLLAGSAEAAGAGLVCGASVVDCKAAADGWRLELREDTDSSEAGRAELRANVVIDATGRGARVASSLGARRFAFDHLVGVAGQFERANTAEEGYVLVEASADGWWYTAPVPDGRMMAMLMTDSDLCGRGAFAGGPAWTARLQNASATWTRVRGTEAAWGPRVFPATSQRLRRGKQYARWLAVGDAALAVDPISGSGVVRALRSARVVARTAIALLNGGGREVIEAHEAECDQECTAYLYERASYYHLERRWPGLPFWERRNHPISRVTT